MSKTTLSVLLAGLGSLVIPSLGAAPQPRAAITYDVITATSLQGHLDHGTWRADVIEQSGYPAETLGDGVWLYWNFRANLEQAKNDGCDTLVVTFKKSKVDIVRLANKPAVELMRARRLRHHGPRGDCCRRT